VTVSVGVGEGIGDDIGEVVGEEVGEEAGVLVEVGSWVDFGLVDGLPVGI
jgi:hypothetical protein